MVLDPAMVLFMVLCVVVILFLFTFTVRRTEARGLSYWFTAKFAVGLVVGQSIAYLIQYCFTPSTVETGYIILLGLIGLFAVILVARFRNLKKGKLIIWLLQPTLAIISRIPAFYTKRRRRKG